MSFHKFKKSFLIKLMTLFGFGGMAVFCATSCQKSTPQEAPTTSEPISSNELTGDEHISSVPSVTMARHVFTIKLLARQEDVIKVFTSLANEIQQNSKVYIHDADIRANDEVDATGRVIKSGKDILKAFVLAHNDVIPSGRDIVYEKTDRGELALVDGEDPTKSIWRIRLVRTDIQVVSSNNVKTYHQAIDTDINMPYIMIQLDKKGTETFYNVTKMHVSEKLAIIIDDQLMQDPVIRSEIPGGSLSIPMESEEMLKLFVNSLHPDVLPEGGL